MGWRPKYQGNVIACDWGLQTVFRYELTKSGATFKVAKREPLITKGGLGDFRPFSLAVDADRNGLILVDWAYNGWLADGPRTGRLFRLRYGGKDKVAPSNDPCGFMAEVKVFDELNHWARAVRLAAQRKVAAGAWETILPGLIARKPDPRIEGDRFEEGRVHALWALDAINSPTARASIREALSHPSNVVRLQAVRSVGIRRDKQASATVAKLLGDLDPAVRREAAIALGRIGDASAAPALHAALGQGDRLVAWSVRQAIRRLGAWDSGSLKAALRDPKRRDDALALVDESWAAPAIDALSAAFAEEPDPAVRSRILANLAGQYRKYPEWDGHWFGTNPLAGAFPAKTVDWDRLAMRAVLVGLAHGLVDPTASVRRTSIAAFSGIGAEAATTFLAAPPARGSTRPTAPR